MGDGHLTEHAHDQYHQGAGHEVRKNGSWPGRRDGVPGTYESPAPMMPAMDNIVT